MSETKEKVNVLEDRIMTLALNNPRILLSVPFNIGIFAKWRDVVAMMITQLNNSITPSVATVVHALPALTEMQESELCELIWDSRAKPDNYDFLLSELARLDAEMRLWAEMKKIMVSVNHENLPSGALGKLSALAINSFSSAQNSGPSCDAKGIIEAMDNRLKEIEENQGRYSLSSGIEALDRNYSGLHPGKLIVVGANTGKGKTSFAVTVMSNMARQGYRIGLVSTEQPREEVGFKLNSLLSGVAYEDMSQGKIGKNDPRWIDVDRANKIMASQGLYVCDRPKMKVAEVNMQCQAWKTLYNVDLVIVDYLTRLDLEEGKNGWVIAVGKAVTEMKNIARELRIPVMLLAQLNRAAEGKLPSKINLKDSSVIEQEADSILLLSRPTEDDEGAVTAVIVDKNRHGKSNIKIEVEFNGPTGRWF